MWMSHFNLRDYSFVKIIRQYVPYNQHNIHVHQYSSIQEICIYNLKYIGWLYSYHSDKHSVLFWCAEACYPFHLLEKIEYATVRKQCDTLGLSHIETIEYQKFHCSESELMISYNTNNSSLAITQTYLPQHWMCRWCNTSGAVGIKVGLGDSEATTIAKMHAIVLLRAC